MTEQYDIYNIYSDARERHAKRTMLGYYPSTYGRVSLIPGRRTILTIRRTSSEVEVRTVTTRTVPSFPGCSLIIRARGHRVGGVASERIRHNAPISGAGSSLSHFGRGAKVWMYSCDHRCQKWSRICWSSCHRDRVFDASLSSEGSGTASRGAPIRRCPGVSAERSSGSSDRACNGREFKHASI